MKKISYGSQTMYSESNLQSLTWRIGFSFSSGGDKEGLVDRR